MANEMKKNATDTVGATTYNLGLSRRRAQSMSVRKPARMSRRVPMSGTTAWMPSHADFSA